MRRNSRVVVLGFILSFPMMLVFQNCGKLQAPSNTGIVGNVSAVDTNDLPIGNVSIDQTLQTPAKDSAQQSASTSSDSTNAIDGDHISIYDTLVDPKKESLAEIEQAKADCQSLQESSNTSGTISADAKSVSGLSGRNVLSSADFGGSHQIDSIKDSFGIVVLCGLSVKTISNSGGKLILIQNSIVENVNSFYGEISVVEAARAIIQNSKVEILKQ